MKAAVLTGIRTVEVREVPEPTIQTGTDVLLRVAAVGLCGSDLRYYSAGRIGSDVVRFPFIIGHECTAVVEKCGRDVRNVKTGDRVAVDPAVSCGKCDQCLQGRPNTCRHLRFLGCPEQLEGSLAEFIVMPESGCFPLTGEIDTKLGVLAEPLSIGTYAVRLLGRSTVSAAAILGAGPIGLSVGFAAEDAGIRKTYVTDKIDERLKAARKAGAAWTGNPDRTDIVENIMETEPSGLDAVFECCGDQQALDQAVALLKPGGKLIVVGIPETDIITFNAHRLRRKEILIQNVRRQIGCIPAAVDLISRKKSDLDFMVTHTFPLEETRKAFDLAENYRDGVIKAVIQP